MFVHDRLYIEGQWRKPLSSAELISVHDSIDGTVLGRVPAAGADDVAAAVAAAVKARSEWRQAGVEARAAYSRKIANGLAQRADQLAEMITRETGMPLALSREYQVNLPIHSFSSAADIAETFTYCSEYPAYWVQARPIGVVGAITPWNYPLHQISAKVAFALAAGCSVVLKPSEIAPLDAFVLAEVIDEAGLPPGVFNLVPGLGVEAGEALAAHPGVNLISFTGSTRAARRIAELAAAALKRLTLECGGKSANVLLSDLDEGTFERAVRDAIAKCFFNSGQTCTALTRLLVPRERLAIAEEIAVDEITTRYQPGNPLHDGVLLGPLASAQQRERVEGYVRRGLDEGARLIAGGLDRPSHLGAGYYIYGQAFTSVEAGMSIAQEEIFGPVLCLMSYRSVAEAVALANDSIYGLSGGVWGEDQASVADVAAQLETGLIQLNGGGFDPDAPFGGVKASGYGKECGVGGFREFLYTTTLMSRPSH